jgi:hypothetical protein
MPSPPVNVRLRKEKSRVISSKPKRQCNSIEAMLRAFAKNQASSARSAIQRRRASIRAAPIPTDHRFGTVSCLGGLAATAATAGDAELAGYLWATFERLEEQHGTRLNRQRRQYERRLAVLDPKALAHAIERGRTMTFDEAVDYALG